MKGVLAALLTSTEVVEGEEEEEGMLSSCN